MDKRFKEIEARLAEIKAEMNSDGTDVSALTAEVDGLIEERKAIMEKNQSRSALLGKIAGGMAGAGEPPVEPSAGSPTQRGNPLESAEYRSAFLKQLRNLDLSEAEKRTLTTASNSVGAAIPTQTLNQILEKVKQYAPLLDKIDLLHIKGNITIPAEGTTIEAKLHAEGAAISGDNDTLVNIALSSYEITKLVTISKSVETMSIDAFEGWLVRKIGRAVAEKITALILDGTGSSQPQGINKITWNASNSVTVTAAAALTKKNVREAVALLNGGYDSGAEWLMSKKTFYSDFHPLMDSSTDNIITLANGVYYVCGYPVTMDDRVTVHEAFLGNLLLGYVGNLQENVTVTSQFVARENSYDFLGCAMFDGKVSAVEAFVKIIKAGS